MPRLGINYLDVATAATKLIEQNIRPTIETVRHELGTGSNSTINQYLRQWREKQGNQFEAEQDLPETLLIAVKGLHQAIQGEASQKINQIQAEKQKIIDDVSIQLTQLTNQCTEIKKQKAQAEEQVSSYKNQTEQAQQKIFDLEQILDKKKVEIDLLELRLTDRNLEVERLIQQIKHAQHNLEHYRESIREQREEEKKKHETQLIKLEQQLHHEQKYNQQLENQAAAHQKEIDLLKNSNAIFEQQVEELNRHAQNEQEKFHKQEISLNYLQKEHEKLQSENNITIEDLNQVKEKNYELSINIEKYKQQVETFTQSLQKAEDKINMLNDKNLFLHQEKLELANTLRVIEKSDLKHRK